EILLRLLGISFTGFSGRSISSVCPKSIREILQDGGVPHIDHIGDPSHFDTNLKLVSEKAILKAVSWKNSASPRTDSRSDVLMTWTTLEMGIFTFSTLLVILSATLPLTHDRGWVSSWWSASAQPMLPTPLSDHFTGFASHPGFSFIRLSTGDVVCKG
ncbi:hypothetical protein N7453_007007, partial [Penicillium expansum]